MKKIPKTKEQIVQGLKSVQKVRKLRTFVKDKFYPILLTASTSIEDAKYILGSFSNMLMEQFLAKMKETKFEELKLEAKLAKDSPQYEEFKKIIAIFKGEDVYTARELIEGMKNEVDMMVTNELKSRKLETLKTNFFE